MATRKASEAVLQELARTVPELDRRLGRSRSVDLHLAEEERRLRAAAGARRTASQGTVGGGWSYAGRNIHFGVREHAMGAAVNGLAYHGGFIPFGATFLVFSDYMRPAIRLAALSRLRSIFVFTHDSIGLGEDGPTHQAVEQLAALRAIPGSARDPSGRRQRDARRLAGRDRIARSPDGAGPDPPGGPDARPRAVRGRGGAAARRLRPRP